MQAEIPRYVTEEEFLDRPEELVHAELVDGEVVVTPSPSFHHQVLQGDLYTLLRQWAEARPEPWTVLGGPLDTRFGKDRILHPDVVVFARAFPLDTPLPVVEVPALCVEVLSPSNRTYDRTTKRMLYAERGVREFWAVDPAGRVEVFSGPGLHERLAAEGRLTSPTLPGLEVDLAALLRA